MTKSLPSLLTLSTVSQLLSDDERRSWLFRPEHICHGNYTERYACIHVARSVSHEKKLMIVEADRRRSGPAGCGSLAMTVLVAGCVPDLKNEVVARLLVAIREADAGASGVESRRWSRPSSRPPRLRWRLHR